MANEITLESLHELITNQGKQLTEQSEKIATLTDENKSLKEQVKNYSPSVAEPEKKVKPVKPTEPVEFKGKKYKWQVAIFRILIDGEMKTFTAEEVALDDTKSIVKEILSIKGQGILKELV